jgi:hypothetical protein
MRDLVFLAVVVGFFAVATVFVAGCERIIGSTRDEDTGR